MMTLAGKVGINVPEVKLVPISEISRMLEGVQNLHGSALAVKRFDRREDDSAVPVEDFARIFNVYPDKKYRAASYKNIVTVLAIETNDEDIKEFVRWLIFNTLIGNADLHIKNWLLIYPDRRNAFLAPVYDFVSTIAYLKDEKAALKYARSRRMDELTEEELMYLAAKSRLSETLVLGTAKETVSRFHEIWANEKSNLTLTRHVIDTIDTHVVRLPIASLTA